MTTQQQNKPPQKPPKNPTELILIYLWATDRGDGAKRDLANKLRRCNLTEMDVNRCMRVADLVITDGQWEDYESAI